MHAIVPLMDLRAQGMKAKEIAKLLEMGERTVRDWLKQGSFPETKKRRNKLRMSIIFDFATSTKRRHEPSYPSKHRYEHLTFFSLPVIN